MCSNPCESEVTCFRPESNRGPYGLLTFLSAALSTTELRWQMNHRKSFTTHAYSLSHTQTPFLSLSLSLSYTHKCIDTHTCVERTHVRVALADLGWPSWIPHVDAVPHSWGRHPPCERGATSTGLWSIFPPEHAKLPTTHAKFGQTVREYRHFERSLREFRQAQLVPKTHDYIVVLPKLVPPTWCNGLMTLTRMKLNFRSLWLVAQVRRARRSCTAARVLARRSCRAPTRKRPLTLYVYVSVCLTCRVCVRV